LAIQAAAQQATPTRNIAGTELKILQWSHFVPSYDTWFDEFAKAWGDANQVKITVDHINTAQIPATLAGEIAAGEGHDLVEHISSLAQYEKSVVDMTDLVNEATARFGTQLDMAKRNSFNPTTNHFYGFVHGYAPDPADYRKSLWQAVELPDGPRTYQELLDGGTKIYQDQGVQMGIGMSNEIDSRMAAQTIIWAHGGGPHFSKIRTERILHLEQHFKQLSDEIARYFKHPDDRANCPAKLVNHTIEGSQPEPDSD